MEATTETLPQPDYDVARDAIPKSLDAEKAVIGALLSEPILLDEVIGVVSGHSFYWAAHKLIFQAVVDLTAAGRPFDLLGVGEHLDNLGRLGDVGGVGYLGQLVSDLPSTKNVLSYAEIVKDRFKRRCWLKLSRRIDQVMTDNSGASFVEREGLCMAAINALDDSDHVGTLKHIDELLPQFLNDVENALNQEEPTGVTTGFKHLDHRTGRFQPGQLIIVGGRPGMGKTTFMTALARNAAHDDSGVAMFSLEMGHSEMIRRLVAAEAQVQMGLLKSGKVLELPDSASKLSNGLTRLMHKKIFVDDDACLTVEELAARARRLQRRHGIDLLVIDYLGLVEFSGSDRASTADRISHITRSLKKLAKSMGIPIILGCQLSRKVEERSINNRRPVMSDLRDSGAIEQDADIVMFVYRDEVYKPENTDRPGIIEIIFAKGRDIETGTDYLNFVGAKNLIMETEETLRLQQRLENEDSGSDGFDP